MRKRLKTTGGVAAALVALALGGSAIASATQGVHTHKKHAKPVAEKIGGRDTDTIQSGDQRTPDKGAAKASSAASAAAPEAGAVSENSTSESATGESSTPSDGPGGHEDPPGNVDYQSESQE
jgi:hypothetical protein